MRVSLLAALFVLAFACQRQEHVDVAREGGQQPTTTVPVATATDAIPAERDSPGARPSVAGPVQEVHLIEYQIHMPESLPAGKITFNIENGGEEEHGLVIEGNGIEQKTATLKKGDTAALDVELKPGTYTVYCPVDDHKGKGMKRTLVVK